MVSSAALSVDLEEFNPCLLTWIQGVHRDMPRPCLGNFHVIIYDMIDDKVSDFGCLCSRPGSFSLVSITCIICVVSIQGSESF